nr:Gfo/Idh/MocA family oxidoreductase [Plantibacter sp. CFBP 8804]
MVAHVVRFFGGYEAIDDAVRDGAVGTPLAVTAERLSSPAAPSPWWQDERRSGGPLVDFAIHDFDQLNQLLGQPRSVSARRTGTGRPIETTVDYADGGIGRVLTSMELPPAFGFSSAIEVLGSTGLIAHRFVGASPTHAPPLSVDALGTAAAHGPYDLDETDPYRRQMASFLDCVERDVQPFRVTGRSALAALTVALAAKASLDAGVPVRIAEPHDA